MSKSPKIHPSQMRHQKYSKEPMTPAWLTAMERDTEQRMRQEEAKLRRATTTAKETGKPVIIKQWVTHRCMNKSFDCSFDRATTYMLPDGTTKTEYVCCY